jgi:chitin synthase
MSEAIERYMSGLSDTRLLRRTNLLLCFVLSNALLASLILGGGGTSTTFSDSSSRTSVYMLIILIFVAATNLFRLIGAVLYLLIGLATRLQSIF